MLGSERCMGTTYWEDKILQLKWTDKPPPTMTHELLCLEPKCTARGSRSRDSIRLSFGEMGSKPKKRWLTAHLLSWISMSLEIVIPGNKRGLWGKGWPPFMSSGLPRVDFIYRRKCLLKPARWAGPTCPEFPGRSTVRGVLSNTSGVAFTLEGTAQSSDLPQGRGSRQKPEQ